MLASSADEFTARMFGAVNAMVLDALAAVARQDYEGRRRRQAQGQAKAKAEGRYRGRNENTARSRLARHFRVQGDRSVHFGAFDCSGGGRPDDTATACAPGCC